MMGRCYENGALSVDVALPVPMPGDLGEGRAAERAYCFALLLRKSLSSTSIAVSTLKTVELITPSTGLKFSGGMATQPAGTGICSVVPSKVETLRISRALDVVSRSSAAPSIIGPDLGFNRPRPDLTKSNQWYSGFRISQVRSSSAGFLSREDCITVRAYRKTTRSEFCNSSFAKSTSSFDFSLASSASWSARSRASLAFSLARSLLNAALFLSVAVTPKKPKIPTIIATIPDTIAARPVWNSFISSSQSMNWLVA